MSDKKESETMSQEQPAPHSPAANQEQKEPDPKTITKGSSGTGDPLVNDDKTPVIVLGDMQIDNLVVESAPLPGEQESLKLNWQAEKQRHVLSIQQPGGIWLIAEVIRKALEDPEENGTQAPRTSGPGVTQGAQNTPIDNVLVLPREPHPADFKNFIGEHCPESLARLALFPRRENRKADGKVYRINGPVMWVNRFNQGTHSVPKEMNMNEVVAKANEWLNARDDAKKLKVPLRPVVVLWDRNNGFRNEWGAERPPNNGEQPLCKLKALLQRVADEDGTIVWQRSQPFDKGGDPLWNVFFDPSSEKIRKKTVVIVRDDCLRRTGLIVQQHSSLEHVVEDFASSLKKRPLSYLSCCQYFILWLQDAAVVFCNDEDPPRCAGPIHYYYCPNTLFEMSAANLGVVYGYTVMFTAALVANLASKPSTSAEERRQQLHDGVRRGVVLAALHFRRGYATEEDVKSALKEDGTKALAKEEGEKSPETKTTDKNEAIDDRAKWLLPYLGLFDKQQTIKDLVRPGSSPEKIHQDYLVAALEFHREDAEKQRLSRCKAFLRLKKEVDKEDPVKTLYRAVTEGLERIGRRERYAANEMPEGTPARTNKTGSDLLLKEEITYPFVTFGPLQTADRHEIEGYMSIFKLIRNYYEDRKVERPVSIATFGPPGAGKSFAIKAIVESIDPNAAKLALEFNLAQFTDPRDLTDAFHQAQDRTIEGVLPLVIFDEFDATFQKDKLGWLKHFLAPMQDGLFKDGTRMYRLGRAIFLFSGGTQDTFEDFRKPKRYSGFRDAKVPDFVSRLRGYFNVTTIDSPSDVVDPELLFRRATLLRSILKRKRSNLFDGDTAQVDKSIVHAFLNVPRYRHGVRSMEAIVEMSSASSTRFEKSNLPAPSQLELHVDAETFLRKLNEV